MTTSGRVLLADDSPHAQRMGERILREEGYEVVTVTDGETAIIRLKDVDPDVVIVDAFLPQVSGYDLCGFIKKQPQHSNVKVLLTSTALEKVDEDHAYRVGADGQLKKPFEASVMLKSLKDLIGGSEKKQKRAGTTLDLSYTGDDPVQPEPTPVAPPPEESAPDKPVSALQAWLQQHDSGAFSGDAAEAPKEPVAAAPPPEPEPVAEDQPAMARLSNPQLLRRAGEEVEDLSLRNNPVAKLRYGNKAAPAESREEPENLLDRGDASRGSVRQFRTQPPPPETDPSAGEAARTPRKSLLEQLEEFERASQAQEEVPEEVAPKLSATAKIAPAPPAPELQTPAQSRQEPAQSRQEFETPEARTKPVVPDLDEEVASLAKAEAEASDEDDEEFLMMRARKGRGARVSLLEALADPAEASAPAAADSAVEEDAVSESTVDDAAAAVVEPLVSALSAPETETASLEAALAEAPAPEAAVVEAAVGEAAGAAVLSIREAGVRLDEEELRAVIEIAVSAAMPTIVEEVSRCVALALESRYADKAAQNGHHPQD